MEKIDIEPLVLRLEELSKNKNLELFINFREIGWVDDLFKDELTQEYEEIEEKLKSALLNEINERSSSVFENINLRDFNLHDIRHKLSSLTLPHWQSRNEIEIKRDKLLFLQYPFYSNNYERVIKYQQLQEIETQRKELSLKLKQDITADFKTIFLEELESYKIQIVLQKLVDHYYSFSTIDYSSYTKERAKQYYECRTNEVIERDTYGYIDIGVYERSLNAALNQAIELFQSNSKSDCIELFLTFLRNKIAESNSEKYPSNIDDDLYHYASDLFDSRTEDKIKDDRSRLIVLETYLHWRHSAIKQIEIEYPEKFADDEYYDDEFDDYDNFDAPDSRYEKYGGYNGYDDDTIDNAFEGDPTNTWNVD